MDGSSGVAAMRVAHVGNSSVRYEIALFGEGRDRAAAQGHFVHVYVDRESRRPAPLPASWREALASVAAKVLPGERGAQRPV